MASTSDVRRTASTAERLLGRVLNADEVDGHADLARVILTGAATDGRSDILRLRRILELAVEAMGSGGLSSNVLVTPAGYVHRKLHGEWPYTRGWDTKLEDYQILAAIAADVAGELVDASLLSRARGIVEHFIIGVDVSPTGENEPTTEVACHVDVSTGAVAPVTGKSYPTTRQERLLIRNRDLASHVLPLDGERVVVLVCHDLSAWSPRGNAVAKHQRAAAWQAMQESVRGQAPTLAVHLTHTAHTAATWRPAWSRFAKQMGGQFRSGTSAIRYMNQRWAPIEGPPDPKLLAATTRGTPAIDVIVSGAD